MPVIENPILRGFRPDPSIVRVGADYFIATSTFEWFPGVPLHHSRDLVHWRIAGHALTRTAQLDLRGIADSCGVWAPSLSYADGQFWLVYTIIRAAGMGRAFKDIGIYLTTAANILGPWSDPVSLNAIGFDPSLFHDADGRKWLVNMQWDFRQRGVDRFAGIVAQEYDPRARRLVGPLTPLLAKPGVLLEGPNLYKREGWYYLMLAEGGTGWEHGIAMARARHVLGPYEFDPQPAVLTTRDAPTHPLQKAGHGELVETQTGEWYLAHLASRPIEVGRVFPHAPSSAVDPRRIKDNPPYPETVRRCPLGRETCLQKVAWSADGWLRLDQESQPLPTPPTQQPWHPRLNVSAPGSLAPAPWPAAPVRDDFDSPRLDPTWSSLRVPADESWLSLAERPGWLRLRGRDSLHSLFTQSLVAKRLPALRCVAETRVDFAPSHFTQMAGLVCYYDTRTHYYLRITHDESRGKIVGVMLTDDGAYSELPDAQLPIADWPGVHLRVTINREMLQFAVSRDGAGWQNIGPVLDASKLSDDYGAGLHFTGAMIGLCAQDLNNTRTPADFDYFSLREE